MELTEGPSFECGEGPWVAAWWAGEASSEEVAPGRGLAIREGTRLPMPSFGGNTGRALNGGLPGAGIQWPDLLGSLEIRLWS